MEGLFATGEISSAIEGANRMGGNSVGASLVFSRRAIKKATQYKERVVDSVCPEYPSRHNSKKLILNYGHEFSILREMMSRYAGIVRDSEGLKKTLDHVNSLIYKIPDEDKITEFYHSVRTAKVILLAMLARTESRGSHYRKDYPERDTNDYRIEIYKQDNSEEIEVKKINQTR